MMIENWARERWGYSADDQYLVFFKSCTKRATPITLLQTSLGRRYSIHLKPLIILHTSNTFTEKKTYQ